MSNNHLLYRVECRMFGRAYFKAIAAFDCSEAASGYAKDCAEVHPYHDYQVRYGKKVLHCLYGNTRQTVSK